MKKVSSSRSRRERSRKLDSLRKTLKRIMHDKIGILGISLLTFSLTVCIFAPLFSQSDLFNQNLEQKLLSPNRHHLLGTDEMGRDVLTRLLYGGRYTIAVSFLAVLIALAVGIPTGILSGYMGSFLDDLLMRITDLMLSIPYFLYAIVIVSVLGPSLANCMLAIAIRLVGSYMRLARGLTLEIKEYDYIKAAKIAGFRHVYILVRNVVPNISAPIIVLSTLNIADSILMTAALGFIGLGAQPPSPEWGAMLSSARYYMFSAPHLMIFTGIMVVITVLGFNLMGDSLRDLLDPSMRTYLK